MTSRSFLRCVWQRLALRSPRPPANEPKGNRNSSRGKAAMTEPVTLKKALRDGIDVSAYAEHGFTQLEDLLKAIRNFANLTGAADLATFAAAGMTVAQEYRIIADDYLDVFE